MIDMSTLEYFKNIDSKEGIFLWMTMLISFFLGFLIAYLLRSGKVRRLKREAREQAEQQQTLTAQLQSAQEQLKERNQELQEESRERVALMDRLALQEKQQEGHLTEVYQLNQQIEELNANNRTHALTVEELNGQLLTLESQNAELKANPVSFSNLPTNTATDETESTDVSGLNQRLNEFENVLARLSNENAQLKSSLEEMKGQEVTATVGSIALVDEPTPQVQTDKTVLYEKIIVSDREQDDLTKIDGVGSFLATKLHSIGVFSYEDIARWTPERIEQVTNDIGYLPGRIEKDQWVNQAAVLVQNKPAARSIVEPKVVEPKAEPAQTSKKGKSAEDLKLIEGIGPKIEEVLKAAGINNWSDLARTEPGDLKDILEEAGGRFRMHNPYTWPLQARMAAGSRWDELQQYQDELKGGR